MKELSKAARESMRMAEVLKLSLVEGLSVRAIARKLKMARRTVRKLLGRAAGRPNPPAAARPMLLVPYEKEIRRLLDHTPEL
jgi:transposase